MTDWVAFAGFSVLLAVAVVALTRQSAKQLERLDLSALALLANTAGTQAVLAVLVAVGLWLTAVPVSTLRPGVSGPAVALGAAAGLAISLANEALVRGFDAAGVGYDESLREALTPGSVGGWLFLVLVALPVVAGVEELLFRGVLVGALATGFGVSPWLLAVLSSVGFGAAHTAQGAVGVAATTLLGFALAAVFLVTDSLLAAIVAHYVVNVVEFVVHAPHTRVGP
jgi:membrane protease YdiL (CAAX protease family)